MKLTDHRSWLAGTAAATLVAADLTAATATSAQAASGCQLSYTVSSQWPGGFGANVSITDATSGGLTTPYSGPLPNGCSPMKLQASILLGAGGDNSDYDTGEFFEGAVTAGYPSDGTENAVQASIVGAGYQ